MGFLIDTCIWIDVERGKLSPADVSGFTKKESVYISPVTIAELSFGLEMAKNESVRQKRMEAIERLKNKPFISIDEITGKVFGRIAAALRQKGIDHKYRIQDIWLASQAIQHSLKLLTYNEKDFADIHELDLVVFL